MPQQIMSRESVVVTAIHNVFFIASSNLIFLQFQGCPNWPRDFWEIHLKIFAIYAFIYHFEVILEASGRYSFIERGTNIKGKI